MKFIDLFAGIGGFRMGMEAVGHECLAYCEIDKFARKSYQAMYDTKGELEYHDIRSITDAEYRQFRGKVDIVCGGFPCQAFSLAGSRLGFADTRGTLFFEIARCAKEVQPRFLFLENVKGLLNHQEGRTFRTILSTLDELGYDVEWQVLNSKDFGLPQNRERVFIIGHSRNYCPRFLFPLRSAVSPVSLERVGNSKLVKDMGNGQKVAIPVLSPERLNKRQNGRRFKENQDPMFTLTGQDRHGVIVAGNLPTSFAQSGRVYDKSGLSPTLTTMQGGDTVPKILETHHYPHYKIREETKKGYSEAVVGDSVNLAYASSSGRRARVGKGIAHTLTTSGNMGVVVAQDSRGESILGTILDNCFYRLRIRRLTPRECFRLQGFPDWAFDKAASVSSKSQLYKQAGNSVSVPIITTIAELLKQVEEEDEHTGIYQGE
ncbi:TPA: DNA (cytosine-5-)-methyltransferase [Streptococcus suis]